MNIKDAAQLNIIAAFGLKNAPPETQREFLEDTVSTILDRVVEKIKERLNYQERQEFTRVCRTDAPETERVAFLNAHVPDFEDLIIQETLIFKKDFAERLNAST